MTAYLLHSDSPLGRRGGHEARHYLGWCPDGPGALDHRLDEHRFGNPQAKIVEAFGEDRPDLSLVAVWPGATKSDERKLKRSGHHERHCWRCLLAEGTRRHIALQEQLRCLKKK